MENSTLNHQICTHQSCLENGESKFVMEDINKAMARLQPEYSGPFLRYFEGYKYHEIADELNIPIGTVKTRIHMARQFLKNELKMYNKRLEMMH